MKMKAFLSKINVQISLAFLTLSIVFVSLLSFAFYYAAGQILVDNIRKQTAESVAQTGDYLYAYFDKILSLSDIIAMHPDTTKALEQGDTEAIESLSGIVQISAMSDTRIQSIAVISKNGFALTSDSNMAIPLSGNMMEESWYQAAVASKQIPVVTSIRHGEFTMDKESWVISISHEIVGSQGEHLGVVLIDLSYKFIEDYISGLDLGSTGYAYIFDQNHQILYHPEEKALMDEMKASELLELAKEMDGSLSRNRIVTKKEIPQLQWTLVGISSMEKMDDLKRQMMGMIVWINLLLIVVGIFISWAVSRRLTKPIFELQRAMQDVDKNWGHIQISSRSSTELKALTEEYNALLDRIKKLTEDIAEKENTKRIFELKALQSQINPHFLYNTLDTILWLAEFGENEKVVEVSKALGEMLRLSLNINQDMVSLTQEIAHTKNYLKIQQQRYLDKIEYQISGDKNLQNVEVPKLILQPIVENSIYHGIRPKKGKGLIEISYYKEKEDLILQVKDNGLGYHPEKKEEHLIKTRLGGIGLKNVDQRIKILYGEDYGLTIGNHEEGGTIVRYRLKM